MRLRSVFLPVSSLITGKDIQANQIRDEYLFLMTEPIRVAVYTPALSSVPPGFNLKTTMIPVGAVH
jgi:hypothetical protein